MDLFTAKGAIEVEEPMFYKDAFPYDDFPKNAFIEGTYPYDIPEDIWVTDTTFRDGQQSMESFTPKQIEDIFTYMHLMDNGNGIIRQSEFFIYSDRDREAIERCQALNYEFPEITTWIRPLPNDIALAASMGIKETGVLMSCSDYHIFGKLNKNRREVFDMYLEAAANIMEKGIRPRCHLEDITRADVFGFVIPLIKALDEMGKSNGVDIKFRLCDTLGVGKPFSRMAIPRGVPALVHHVKEETGVHATQLEWHGHNDYYYAVANSTAAWMHGLSSISSTLLGIGERTGNTPMEAMLVEYTQLKQPKNPLNFHALTEIARYFEREFRYSVPPKTPFVGEDFNATKAGIHADGLLKHEDIYNSVDTLKVFNRPVRIAINQFSGNAGIAAWINAEYGFLGDEKITKKDPLVHKIKAWIDDQYASGRNTAISDCEMHFLVGKFIVSIRTGKDEDLKNIIIPGVVEIVANLTEKIISRHITDGEMKPGTEIGLKIDQTLTQDSTGTMAYLELEAMGIDRVKTKLSVAYIDHNMLQAGPENFDDHLFIQSAAKNYGIWFSKPGNGICHQVHLERFGVPGDTLIGSDSHTPTAGGLGMLAIGAGGVDVAAAMAGRSYYIQMPEVIEVHLTGHLRPGVSAKDIILYVLQQETVKGGVNKVYEYTGEGVKTLSVPERATITNMGAELGATTSVFPSDETTREFLKSMGREDAYQPLSADADATYVKTIEVKLDELVPLVACPHSPDKVVAVSELAGEVIQQVAIGSCTNSSYLDLAKCAMLLKGKKVNENISLVISPGSRQILKRLADDGLLSIFLEAGARVLECGCGPCIGMGQAPCNNGKSLRTFNRNFYGRSGTKSADVYLVSPETAIASALAGVITDPSGIEAFSAAKVPEKFEIDDNLLIAPNEDYIGKTELVKGPNIKGVPAAVPPQDAFSAKVLTVLEDNITTDHIMPSNASLLPYRSNIPHLADYCLTPSDAEFPAKAKANGGGIIVAGDNYGQGSSREHAALAPLYLGVKAVIAKSFARIHKQNLVNNGIMPLVFANPADYDKIHEGDELAFDNLIAQIKTGSVTMTNKTTGDVIALNIELGGRQEGLLLAGGLLTSIKMAR